ncbi:hypothetical protein RQP46_005076 [Phenoliferia psychrophenolica]
MSTSSSASSFDEEHTRGTSLRRPSRTSISSQTNTSPSKAISIPTSASLARRLSARLPPTPHDDPSHPPNTRNSFAYLSNLLPTTFPSSSVPLVRSKSALEAASPREPDTKRAGKDRRMSSIGSAASDAGTFESFQRITLAFPEAPSARGAREKSGRGEEEQGASGDLATETLKSDGASFITMSSWRNSLAFDVFPAARPRSTAPHSPRSTTYSSDIESSPSSSPDPSTPIHSPSPAGGMMSPSTSIRSFDSGISLPTRGVGHVGADGLVKSEVGSRRISAAPWEEEEEEARSSGPKDEEGDEYKGDALDRMMDAQNVGGEGMSPEEHERKRLEIAAVLDAPVAPTNRFGLGFSSWRSRAPEPISSTSTDNSHPTPAYPSPTRARLAPTPLPLNFVPLVQRRSLEVPRSPASPTAPDMLRRNSATFSDASGFSEYEDARAETPVLSFTDTPSEHEESEVDEDDLPAPCPAPLLAFSKQQTSLWVLDTLASVGGSDEAGNRMSVIGEEEEEGDEDLPPRTTPHRKRTTPLSLATLAESSSSPFDAPPTNGEGIYAQSNASTYSHAPSFTPSSNPSQSRSSTIGSRLTGIFRKSGTPSRSFNNVGISSDSVGLSTSSSAPASILTTTDGGGNGDEESERRMSNDSFGGSQGGTEDEFGPTRGGGSPNGKVGPVVETPEGKALVGMLEQFAIEEKERLRSIARRVSVV